MGALIQLAACEHSWAADAAKTACSSARSSFFWIFGLKQTPKIYLMINEAYVSGEYCGDPVAAQLDIDVLR